MTRADAPRRLLAALALPLVVLATGLGAAVPASAAPAQEVPGTTSPATITVKAQTYEVAPQGQFRVLFDVAGAPEGARIAVEIYDRITDIDDLAASATTQPNGLLANFDPFPVGDGDQGFTIYLYGADDPLPQGVPRPWVRELDEPGVYPVRVKLWNADDEIVTSIVTYLVRQPAADQSVLPADVALLTTVHQAPATPGRGDRATADPPPVADGYRDRLDAVLAAFADQPDLAASFAVTPETAERLAADPASAETLAALKREVGRDARSLLGAPFVDLDPASLVANDLTGELTTQSDLGRATLRLTVGTPRADTWVVDHPVDAEALGALHDLGITHVVLPEAAVVASQARGPIRVPSTRGTVTAATTGFFDLTGTGPDDPVLAAHQLYARLAAAGTIGPGTAGLTVRIDPAKVDPTQLQVLLTGLAAPGSFLRPVTVAQLFQDVPATDAPTALAPAAPSSLAGYATQLAATRHLLASYQSMVPDRPQVGEAFQQPLATTTSADLDESTRRRELDAIERQLRARFAGISTPAEDRVTLGARDARFPLPITSKLDEPVKVVISLEASDRLSFPDATIETTLTSERTVVQIPVRTRATGDTPLRITVRTPDGAVVLAESRYRVRSTAVSGVGLLLTVGAGGFLALWWGRHWIRTRRQSHGRHGRHGRSGPSAELPDRDFLDEDPAPGVAPT